MQKYHSRGVEVCVSSSCCFSFFLCLLDQPWIQAPLHCQWYLSICLPISECSCAVWPPPGRLCQDYLYSQEGNTRSFNVGGASHQHDGVRWETTMVIYGPHGVLMCSKVKITSLTLLWKFGGFRLFESSWCNFYCFSCLIGLCLREPTFFQAARGSRNSIPAMAMLRNLCILGQLLLAVSKFESWCLGQLDRKVSTSRFEKTPEMGSFHSRFQHSGDRMGLLYGAVVK